MSKRFKTLIEYSEFVLTRVFGTGVETFILWICSEYLFESYFWVYIFSPVVGFEFAVMSNFLFSYFWIWGARIKNKSFHNFLYRFSLFNLSSITGFLVKMIFLLIFERIFGWNVIYCNLVALLISGLLNFFLADMWVFRNKKSETTFME